MNEFPLRIQELAQNKGLSIRRLAIKSGVDISVVRNYWYSKLQRIDYVTSKKIAAVLEVHVRDLIGEEPASSIPSEVSESHGD
jgi:transcriptional regulator with XRE-family HTH domain